MENETMNEERRAFLSKVAAVSIATAFGGVTAVTRAHAGAGGRSTFKVVSTGRPPDAGKPAGSVLREGDLGKLGDLLDQHPDAAVRVVLKQTAEGLVTKEDARNKFGTDLYGALKGLNIDIPKNLLPAKLTVPPGVREAASKRKGWGIGSGHSNYNYWSQHSNHHNHSDYSDWW